MKNILGGRRAVLPPVFPHRGASAGVAPLNHFKTCNLHEMSKFWISYLPAEVNVWGMSVRICDGGISVHVAAVPQCPSISSEILIHTITSRSCGNLGSSTYHWLSGEIWTHACSYRIVFGSSIIQKTHYEILTKLHNLFLLSCQTAVKLSNQDKF